MKQKLIDCINGVLKHLPWGEISSHTAEDIADRLIEHGLATDNNVGDKWISVKDRLPEMHEAVLVYTLTHDVLKAHFRGERSFFGHDGIWRSVTHWMPLPKPPKEDV